MSYFWALLIPSAILSPLQAKAMIFGTDDRLERYQLNSPSLVSYSKSTAALMLRTQLDEVTLNGQIQNFHIDFKKPGNGPVPESGACNRAFVGEPQITSYCSSTLIGEDLLLTAGHCMNRGEDIILPKQICEQTVAVFDYAYESADHMPIDFPVENVFNCKEVVFYSASAELDLALIRLDRPVKNREIFKLKKRDSIPMQIGKTLYTSGYPRGMPNKTVLSASMVKYHQDFPAQNTGRFYADVLGGSSGSSVIDPLTREIVGVLISSDCDDFEYDQVNQCFYEPVFNYQCNSVEMTLMERTSQLLDPFTRSSFLVK